MILLYHDCGVAREGVLSLVRLFRAWERPYRLVTSSYLLRKPWEERATHLVIPGGRDIPYHQKLRGEANRRIRSFVEQGGHYVGICAGAYYGCAEVQFDLGGKLEVREKRELCFFKGKAVGPFLAKGRFSYYSRRGARIAYLDEHAEGKRLPSYFNGGCTFRGEDPAMQPLATYADSEQAAAIIRCKVGEGSATLSGVHPELGVSTISKFDPFTRSFRKPLQESEQARERLLRTFFQSV